jgi:hypothetical protein
MYGRGPTVDGRKLRPGAAQSHRLPNQSRVIAHNGALPSNVIDHLLAMAEQCFRRE